MSSQATDPILGIDVGGTSLKWALVATGELRACGDEPTPTDPDGVLAAIADLAGRHAAMRIGIAVPGPVSDDQQVTFVPNLKGDWSRRHLLAETVQLTGRPAVVMNDAMAHALAEVRAGAAAGYRDAVLITLGTGVGGAVAIDGRVHRGALNRAGELGHLVIDPDGDPCVCGNRGCLETFASVTAIRAAAGRYLVGHDGDPPSLAAVIDAARGGDSAATAALDRAGRALGIALTAVCAVLAPEVVVIGGGGAAAWPLLATATGEILRRRDRLLAPPPIMVSPLGIHAGALGAAYWAGEALSPASGGHGEGNGK